MSEEALPTLEPAGSISHKKMEFIADSVIERRMPGLMDRILAHISSTMASIRGERGPDPDVDPSVEVMRDLTRAIVGLRRLGPQNGDSGNDDREIKRWHLVLTVIGLMFVVIGAAWSLSEQFDAQSRHLSEEIGKIQATQASQTTSIENISEHQREQDERTTRIEDQLRQLTARRP